MRCVDVSVSFESAGRSRKTTSYRRNCRILRVALGGKESKMDEATFDSIARTLSVSGSRRQAVSGLLATSAGLVMGVLTHGDVEARKKRKRRKCRGKKRCAGACIPLDACCTDADCGIRRICISGRCVVGQGTCLAGADICNVASGTEVCGPSGGTGCVCYMSTSGQTRCGGGAEIPVACGVCLSDADCAAMYPQTPGVFCVQSAGIGCACGGSTFCSAPCPD